MDIRLYINNFLIDLDPDQKIGYTKQVNSIHSMSDRQSNYSKSFKIPKTAGNIKKFEGLGITGSNTKMPYRRIPARLFVRNLCLIYKGWANFLESGEDYFDINIYDGNIDFFKALDNLKFDEIPMPELEHTKDVATIVDKWSTNLNEEFGYFIADYNGKTFFNQDSQVYLNLDYLVPNVQCKYLWDRIFQHLNFEYEMQVATDPQFLNNYLTYPKGITSGEVGASAISIDFENQKVISYWPYVNWLMWEGRFQFQTDLVEGAIVSNTYNNQLKLWEVPVTGYYNFNISGSIKARAKKGVISYLFLGINLKDKNPKTLDRSELFGTHGRLIARGNVDQIDFNENILLNQGDTVTFIYDKSSMVYSDNSEFNLSVEISNINQTAINQFDFFKGLSAKDFFKELLWKFGLTPYTVKDEDKIKFLTWEERINGDIEDWSERFQSRISESYTVANYAKKNWFRYKYNEESEDFNDGVFDIPNDNLDDSRDVIKSKTYSREKDLISITIPSTAGATRLLPHIKLWEKEFKTDSNGDSITEYKSLDSRYTFIHKVVEDHINTKVGSEQLSIFGSANTLHFAANSVLDSYQRVLEDYYSPFLQLMNDTKVIKAVFKMNLFEFDNYDLKPRIYVKQLGGEFIVDSLTNNDIQGNFVTAELIKINR